MLVKWMHCEHVDMMGFSNESVVRETNCGLMVSNYNLYDNDLDILEILAEVEKNEN